MVFEQVTELLSDGRKFLLNTDSPTYVDFTFAALAGITFIPEQYGGDAPHEKTRKGGCREDKYLTLMLICQNNRF